MRSKLLFSAVDSHTEGMPTRVITGGFKPIPGETMNDKRLYFQKNLDHLRQLLMTEPRGHGAMSGTIFWFAANENDSRGSRAVLATSAKSSADDI